MTLYFTPPVVDHISLSRCFLFFPMTFWDEGLKTTMLIILCKARVFGQCRPFVHMCGKCTGILDFGVVGRNLSEVFKVRNPKRKFFQISKPAMSTFLQFSNLKNAYEHYSACLLLFLNKLGITSRRSSKSQFLRNILQSPLTWVIILILFLFPNSSHSLVGEHANTEVKIPCWLANSEIFVTLGNGTREGWGGVYQKVPFR